MPRPGGSLHGRTALVTGAARGIGAAIGRRLGEAGAVAVLADLDEAEAERTARAIDPSGEPARALRLDVADPASVEAAFAQAGPVDILVNNAGVARLQPFLETSLEEWSRHLAVNLTGAFLCGQAAARGMAARGFGRVVNVSSISGIRASEGRTAYGTSKAGLIGLTRQMAVELASFGITVNAIAPGPVETEMARAGHDAATRAAYAAAVPTARYAQPEEIAALVAFLCSEEAGSMTGAVLPVDGGFLAAGILASRRTERPLDR